eukprot:TRINITY_DN10825_c0_g1_i1.p1 TRINITY_DN10825_c0_g1~~TRINITY_DN10825_c0_g1_i1.p1  ORF type:complete len:493 (+),score=76.71 TRINITY_DN10825_c0_g1_i1:59-1537(+)
MQKVRIKRPRKRRHLSWIVVYIISLLIGGGAYYGLYKEKEENRELLTAKGRHLMQTTDTRTLTMIEEDDGSDDPYPKVFFSKEDMRNGAVVLCLAGVLYMFAALAIVCDDYFVPALEVIIETLDLSEDVAGATFMAAGGSAPELFTSFIGVFVAKSNVGFGTIVGSAVFNILFVIGCCAVATRHLDPRGLPLTWWPLFRDSLFYSVALFMLYMFYWDKKIEFYEAALLLVLYACYVLFMNVNERYKKRAWEVTGMRWNELATEMVKSEESKMKAPTSIAIEEEPDEDDDGGPWEAKFPTDGSLWEKVSFILFFPLNFLLSSTVPNCSLEEKKKYYVLAFLLSILWIAIFAYFMVWWAEVSSKALGIPSEVMGFTVLAAGTSVPDLITSVIVAKKGLADMAVSSSIGSNMFDVTFGLPLPWAIKSMTTGFDAVDVDSKSLGASVIMLFVMLFTTVAAIAGFGWRLNVALGGTSMVLYIVFVTFSLLIEYDVIG